ncbi:chromosome segregation protein SMC [Kyrpidia spormannii]|nr:chromosome segregation protein SMC [Kyrpidia spormannii]CAB3392634.1 Chromosome partition protein Smc [Kyrpidia spormannii]
MHIKRLEISGFKSFADRTEIELPPGITAVVGPNGSGKSNIAEALRWVLGEQSAKSLRGARMEDVIFAGSDGRKPINYCEVSLTLDNEDGRLPLDYREITVTRRLYRSGESEYRLNRQTCRLKDVIDLFLDTGLGKEAYSMIGQGRIDEVLSNRPEDRRGIFEDAAGIVKFKARKREALKKLEDTKANMMRVEDVIHELTEQATPLAAEAERERQYRALQEEAATIAGRLAVHRIEQTHMEYQRAQDEAVKAEQAAAQEAAALADAEAHLEQRRLELVRQDRELEEIQSSWASWQAEREREEGQRRLLEERVTHLDQTWTEAKNRLQDLISRRETAQGELQRLEAEVRSAEAELEERRRRLEEAEGGYGDAAGTGLEIRLEECKAELIERLNQAAAARNEERHRREALEVAARRRDRLMEESAERSREAQDLKAKLEEVQRQKETVENRVKSLEEADRDRVAQERQLRGRMDQAENGWRRDREQLAALVSKWEVMKDLEESYGGYGRGVKTVLTAAKAGKLSGVLGAVAEVIRVPDGLDSAVEAALGPALQYVVVRDEDAGRQAIEYLKRAKEGRITCIPLSVIRPRTMSEADRQTLSGAPGWVGVAADLVKAEPAFQSLVSYLLGQVAVAKDLRGAVEMARRVRRRYRVVTLEGDVVHPGGTMSGGAPIKGSGSLLSRRRQVELMAQQVDEQRKRVDKGEETLRTLREEEAVLGRAAAENERALHEARKEGNRLQGIQDDLGARLKSLIERLEWDRFEMDRLSQEVDEQTRYMEQARERTVQAERQAALVQEKISALEVERRAMEGQLEERRAIITELKVQLASLRERRAYAVHQREAKVSELRELQRQIAALEKEIGELEKRRDETRSRLITISEQLEEGQSLAAERLRELQDAKEARLREAEAVKRAEAAVAARRQGLHRLEQDLHAWTVRRERLQVELRHALDDLAENFHMGFERAKERFGDVEDPGPLSRRLEELRRSMQSLEPVRSGAVEEYGRLRERLDFLSAQRDDLLAASARLNDLIREMDDEMSSRFLATVKEVGAQFQEVFVRLFGGGRAQLELTDPADPLGTGVEIAAQPPGKKLQTLSLLSGGERALTAIALLFAILRVNPVPVCVLDEVDAALDEANVHRFAKYLREFSHETQFVVITHRKGTMEQADALYGVAMEEAGVSKLVAVRMVDPEPEEQTAS